MRHESSVVAVPFVSPMGPVHGAGDRDGDRVESGADITTQSMPSPRNSSDTSRPTVTALQATPVADCGETAKTTTMASSAGIPTKSAAVCWRSVATSNR